MVTSCCLCKIIRNLTGLQVVRLQMFYFDSMSLFVDFAQILSEIAYLETSEVNVKNAVLCLCSCVLPLHNISPSTF